MRYIKGFILVVVLVGLGFLVLNTDHAKAQEEGCRLTIEKIADPKDDTPFNFTALNTSDPSFTLMDPSDNSILIDFDRNDNIIVTEIVPEGWEFEGIECLLDENDFTEFEIIENGFSVQCNSSNASAVCTFSNVESLKTMVPALFSFFDLRDRESFVQFTNIDSINAAVHVQIFDVSNNCNENNFFDTYTPNDTHVYNMRDIQTNDGNLSGVILPDGAYGFVSIVPVVSVPLSIIGNFRVIDDNGYEYRANSVIQISEFGFLTEGATFNFNTKGNITLSDVVGLTFDFDIEEGEVSAADILDIFVPVDINIVDENEVIFSCRNVVFACTDQDNPLLKALLEEAGAASVASFEYGINNAIPHSKGGELLCPGNTISDGVVTIDRITAGDSQDIDFIGFIGLNNGNGRGSMDSWWYSNTELLQPPPPG